MEMSGLIPDSDYILEVALVITDSQLNMVAEAPVLVVSQPDAVLDNMDKWNKSTHTKSGLIDKVKASKQVEDEVEEDMIAFLQKHIPPKISPMCGNSICQDRRFLVRTMPELEGYFHYRNHGLAEVIMPRWYRSMGCEHCIYCYRLMCAGKI